MKGGWAYSPRRKAATMSAQIRRVTAASQARDEAGHVPAYRWSSTPTPALLHLAHRLFQLPG
jgi:hypothetical protein